MRRLMTYRFEDILDECVERLLKGESMEQCLVLYPGQAVQLEPLLRVAVAIREASSAVKPRAEFKTRTRYEIQSLLYAKEQKTKLKRA
jgi:hypothetical protein